MFQRNAPGPSGAGLDVLVTGTLSDSHTWNLIFLQLFLEDRGHTVTNLGPCVPPALLVSECRSLSPDLVVVSSVNGHGYTDGLRAAEAVRAEPGLADLALVIGGRLGVDGGRDRDGAARLRSAGYDAVFDKGETGPFDRFLTSLSAGRLRVPS